MGFFDHGGKRRRPVGNPTTELIRKWVEGVRERAREIQITSLKIRSGRTEGLEAAL